MSTTAGSRDVMHAVAVALAWLARWRLPLVGLVAAAQALVLAYMVFDRESLLAHGREITLDVRPVDPRSLFRGDYVILSYDISRVPNELFQGNAPRPGDRVYVRLSRAGDGAWKPAGVTKVFPANPGADDVVLLGIADARWWNVTKDSTIVTYGIESFFVPEGSGRAIEAEIRPGKVQANLVVGANGTAAIKALVVDGTRIEAEPLF